ncbi:ATP-binding protein [uncultured Polaribacter sp.]|uniref:sensor histidine kinase n=1 Tax=uncultured Polaribacter sp. TaxID=174711 RepID=UPI0026018CE6|nr:ATP-binding protein [uncultured Polaribacter sp.]
MNSLLKRQIRKFLPEELRSEKKLEKFLDAIDRSYTTSDEQFAMLQRATKISSDELFNVNKQLTKETESQKQVIKKLEGVIDKFQFYDLGDDRPTESSDSLKLADFIDNQTKEIIKINQQKDKLVKSLERQNRELNDYAQLVSHDLKSPLQSIEALTTWVIEDYADVLGEMGKDNLNLIKENVEKIDILVKGILDYSTVGKLEDETYDVDLNIIIDSVFENIDKKSNIHFIKSNALPIVKGNKSKLELLFIHLIQNAIQFNDKEIIEIEIGSEEKDDFWEFYVKDNGKGIDQKYFDKIFIAFQKLEDNYKSSGIGLSIVKKIVEMYNGDIWLKSAVDKGTIFYFKLKK